MKPTIDFRAPDYDAILRHRLEVLRKIRDPKEGPLHLAVCRAHYRLNPWDFIRSGSFLPSRYR